MLVGGAPDTFLGGGLQTCRKLIDEGWIGEPVGRQRLHARAMATKAGIPTPYSTINRGAAPCSTWARTTSPPW